MNEEYYEILDGDEFDYARVICHKLNFFFRSSFFNFINIFTIRGGICFLKALIKE